MQDEPLLISEMEPFEFLRARRRALGLTQQQLAESIGTTQTVVAAVERGRRRLTSPMEERLRGALQADPAELLKRHRDDIKRESAKHGFANVRVFGSLVRGLAGEDSDVDLFIEYADPQHRDAFAVFRLHRRLENLLSVPVDVNLLTGRPLRTPRAQQALQESIAL